MVRLRRRQFLALSAGGLLGSTLSACCIAPRGPHVSKRRPPNIVFLYTDDQGQWAVGAYGNRDIHTPNMDRLAREGMRFTRAFVSTPVCSPARSSVMTSLYSHQTGVHDWLNPKTEKEEGLSPDFTTLAQLLKEAGYVNALVGKWHLGIAERYWPTRRGFDHFFGFLGGGNSPKDPTLWINGKEQKVEGFLTDILTDDAIAFLRRQRSQPRPFTLWFQTRAPHMPYLPVPDEDMAHYEGRDIEVPEVERLDPEVLKRKTREYYASISSVDRNLGRVLDELCQLGLEENTVVIFTSDNGYNLGRHGLETKGNAVTLAKPRRRRPNMFDTSVLVPLIVRWPGVVEPSTVCDEMVAEIDFLPTFLEVAGTRPPRRLHIEGRSFVRLLRGQSPRWRDAIFGSYDMHHGATANMRMIRTRDWKLVRHSEPRGRDELYDLRNDPGELRDLYGDPSVRDTQKALERRLTAWQKRTGDEVVVR